MAAKLLVVTCTTTVKFNCAIPLCIAKEDITYVF